MSSAKPTLAHGGVTMIDCKAVQLTRCSKNTDTLKDWENQVIGFNENLQAATFSPISV